MIFEVLKKYWGFETLRPLQQDVIDSILAGRDSLTVLPTGGGKSLCYQLPAMCLPGLTVVVSPLIALMKDQVDYQQESGRAGRDGSQAECWLFYSPNDMQTWKMVIDKSAQVSQAKAQESLDTIYRYCSSVRCRHQYLNLHFGQETEPPCDACDICLKEPLREAFHGQVTYEQIRLVIACMKNSEAMN